MNGAASRTAFPTHVPRRPGARCTVSPFRPPGAVPPHDATRRGKAGAGRGRGREVAGGERVTPGSRARAEAAAVNGALTPRSRERGKAPPRQRLAPRQPRLTPRARVHSREKRFSQPSTSVSRSGLSPRGGRAALARAAASRRARARSTRARAAPAPRACGRRSRAACRRSRRRARPGASRRRRSRGSPSRRPGPRRESGARRRPSCCPSEVGAEGRAVEDEHGAGALRPAEGRHAGAATSARPSPGTAGPPQEPRRLLPSIR